MPFRPRTAAAGAVLAAATALLGPAAAAARPAAPAPAWSAAPDGTARTAFYLEGTPGTVLTDRLAVRNPTARPVTVRPAGEGATGAWLAFGTAEVTVPPRTRAGVPFTVTVPRDAAPGSRTGTLTVTGGGSGARARIPVRVRVTGAALSALTVEHLAVRRQGGAAVIRYTLVNRGTTALRPRLAVRADGLFGPLPLRTARALPAVLPPGGRADRTETWPDPPVLDAVDVTLTATAPGGARDTATTRYTAVPWAPAATLLTLIAAGCAWTAARRRRRTDGGGSLRGAGRVGRGGRMGGAGRAGRGGRTGGAGGAPGGGGGAGPAPGAGPDLARGPAAGATVAAGPGPGPRPGSEAQTGPRTGSGVRG
ncbi:hypothetical protein MUU72_18370 [Streptomyces sp. RS10V-4]|uniref:COG1470 family protein n=1 Tax=Streptomyces rhizoryzae TaxID=2932493 RepID=UPI002002A218|nr:hypothetical protein [Streptomyces rhizoryzae]MCK7625051.1 hypothetical protein [Streptomyces rhizoryzae]